MPRLTPAERLVPSRILQEIAGFVSTSARARSEEERQREEEVFNLLPERARRLSMQDNNTNLALFVRRFRNRHAAEDCRLRRAVRIEDAEGLNGQLQQRITELEAELRQTIAESEARIRESTSLHEKRLERVESRLESKQKECDNLVGISSYSAND